MKMNKETERSIHEFYDLWFGSMERQDIDAFLSLLADDFYLKSPASPGTSKTGTIRAGLERYHRAYQSQVDWNIDDILLYGNHAIVRISESITMTHNETGEPNQMSGVHLAVLVRDGNGWKLKTDVSSLDHPVSSRE